MVTARRVGLILVVAFAGAPALAQDLGHKVPGTLGLSAGMQAEPGLYLADQPALYSADTLRDSGGNVVPIPGFRLRAIADGVGVGFTFRLQDAYVNFAGSVPFARASLSSDLPQASVDKLGFGDARVQPLGLGWKTPHVDLVGSYALYIPTRLTVPPPFA